MRENINLKPNISANILLKPELSQIAIIVLLIISGLSFFVSFYFSWHSKNWELPLIVAILLLLMAGIGWWKSQRVIDLGNSSPTEISATNGMRILTDTRAIESPNAVNNLAKLIETVSVRIPLPCASGIVDNSGNIIPNSEERGNEIVDSINNKISNLTSEVQACLIRPQQGKTINISDIPLDENINRHSGTT